MRPGPMRAAPPTLTAGSRRDSGASWAPVGPRHRSRAEGRRMIMRSIRGAIRSGALLLGVEADELVPEASLIDDLAADSLDLVELAIVLESTFGITLTRHRMDEVRSFQDLLDVVMTAPVESRRKRELVLTPGLDVKSRLVPPGAREATLERADALTAYAIETIREDALSAGPGTHLEVTLPAQAGTVDLASVRDALAGLDRHGIAVSVRCDAPASAAIPVPPAT